MIAIVNYGLGNIAAIANIYARLGIDAAPVSTPEELSAADRLILPGVGAFDWAMARLNNSGLRPALENAVLNEKKKVLGICVGMQMLAQKSEEGELPGLGWISGEVRRFRDPSPEEKARLPHMGWNDVSPTNGSGLFRELEKEARFYFLHSYYFVPAEENAIAASTDYLGSYASAVQNENIFGVQFHPEKSHRWGIQLLKNFAEV